MNDSIAPGSRINLMHTASCLILNKCQSVEQNQNNCSRPQDWVTQPHAILYTLVLTVRDLEFGLHKRPRFTKGVDGMSNQLALKLNLTESLGGKA